VRLSQFGFPPKTNEVTKAYFSGMAKTDTTAANADLAKVAEGDRAAMARIAKLSPLWNSMLRTTCVATMLEGGHARNALRSSPPPTSTAAWRPAIHWNM